MSEEDVRRSLIGYMGHLSHGDTWRLRENILSHLVLSNETYEGRMEHEAKIKNHIDQIKRHPAQGNPVGSSGGDSDNDGNVGKSMEE